MYSDMPRGIYDREKAGLKKKPEERSTKGRILTQHSALACCLAARQDYYDVIGNLIEAEGQRLEVLDREAMRWILGTLGGPLYDFYDIAKYTIDQLRGRNLPPVQDRDILYEYPDAAAVGYGPVWSEEVTAWTFHNPIDGQAYMPDRPDAAEIRQAFPAETIIDGISFTKDKYFQQDPTKVRRIDKVYWEGWCIDADTGRPVYDAPTFRDLEDGKIRGVLSRPQQSMKKWFAGRKKAIVTWAKSGLKRVPVIDWTLEFVDFWGDLTDYIEGQMNDIEEQMNRSPNSCENCVRARRIQRKENRVGMTGKQWIYTRPRGLPLNKFDGQLPTAEQLDYHKVKRYVRSDIWRDYVDQLKLDEPEMWKIERHERDFPGITEDFRREYAQRSGENRRKVIDIQVTITRR